MAIDAGSGSKGWDDMTAKPPIKDDEKKPDDDDSPEVWKEFEKTVDQILKVQPKAKDTKKQS